MIDEVWTALEEVEDPELGIDIVNLGLVYDISLTDEGYPHILMSLTSPACPLQDEIVADIKDKVEDKTQVEFTFEPLWLPAMMSDLGRQQLTAIGGYIPQY